VSLNFSPASLPGTGLTVPAASGSVATHSGTPSGLKAVQLSTAFRPGSFSSVFAHGVVSSVVGREKLLLLGW